MNIKWEFIILHIYIYFCDSFTLSYMILILENVLYKLNTINYAISICYFIKLYTITEVEFRWSMKVKIFLTLDLANRDI